jgi:hypothetical protein
MQLPYQQGGLIGADGKSFTEELRLGCYGSVVGNLGLEMLAGCLTCNIPLDDPGGGAEELLVLIWKRQWW